MHQDEDFTEDCEGEYVDDLLLLEIQRRRRRDFGQNASSSAASSASGSWTDREQENDYECDSLCSESESAREMNHSDGWFCDSESDINQETDKELIVHDEESQENNTETGMTCMYVHPGL